MFPFIIYYDVHCPDGRVIAFESAEEVTVPSDSAKLESLLVTPDDPVNGLTNPYDFGLSDDVIRYMALTDFIEIKQRV